MVSPRGRGIRRGAHNRLPWVAVVVNKVAAVAGAAGAIAVAAGGATAGTAVAGGAVERGGEELCTLGRKA